MPKYIIRYLFENIVKAEDVIFDMEQGHNVINVEEMGKNDNNEE